MRTSLHTVIHLEMFSISKHLHPSWWQHLTQTRPLLWFLYAIFLSSCFVMFPTDYLLITACIVSLYFVHTESKPHCSCMTLCLTEAERTNVAISITPQYHPGCRMSWVPSSLSARCTMWNRSWTLFQECFWLCCAQRSYSPSAPAQCFPWCSPSACSVLWLLLSWHFTCSLSVWGHAPYSLM